ncbi:MAG: HDOD domain-containing protein, partial [Magnetococcus sp. WYHC-3]
MDPKVEKKLLSIRDLPTLPAVVTRLTTMVNETSTDSKKIALLLQDDPVLSARILRLVNSVLYAGTEPTASVQLAVARIGLVGIRNLATSVAV